jgi:predicted ATP-binding protein involved in virulence
LRQELNEAGLLEPSTHEDMLPVSSIDASKLEVLSVYINDVERKLNVFSDLRMRIELFRDLLNRRFFYKRVRVDKTRGLVFQTDTGQELSPTALSTGEQHEIVILYQLLFLAQPNSLILIDEPEISLHVAWQEQFLSDLTRISELSQLDFLVATHSPQIISNRWDLTVELKGPKR